jgi:hypothetical protein
VHKCLSQVIHSLSDTLALRSHYSLTHSYALLLSLVSLFLAVSTGSTTSRVYTSAFHHSVTLSRISLSNNLHSLIQLYILLTFFSLWSASSCSSNWLHQVESAPTRTISINWWRTPDARRKDVIGKLMCGHTNRKAARRC